MYYFYILSFYYCLTIKKMINDPGSLCLCVVLILIVIVAYDKYMGMRKAGFNQGFTEDSQMFGSSPQEFNYYTYSGYSGDTMGRNMGVNPYTLARTYN